MDITTEYCGHNRQVSSLAYRPPSNRIGPGCSVSLLLHVLLDQQVHAGVQAHAERFGVGLIFFFGALRDNFFSLTNNIYIFFEKEGLFYGNRNKPNR